MKPTYTKVLVARKLPVPESKPVIKTPVSKQKSRRNFLFACLGIQLGVIVLFTASFAFGYSEFSISGSNKEKKNVSVDEGDTTKEDIDDSEIPSEEFGPELFEVIPIIPVDLISFCENIPLERKVRAIENDYITLVFYSNMTVDQCVTFLETSEYISSFFPGASNTNKITYYEDIKVNDAFNIDEYPDHVLFKPGEVAGGIFIGVMIVDRNGSGYSVGRFFWDEVFHLGHITLDSSNLDTSVFEDRITCFMSTAAGANDLTGYDMNTC
eukprot:snap_masked-scaffold_9-processed-gene-9.17-mRNA-1 protein AED:1.00 eAED:1.00 QI:0/0/0/0/1/1/2/0/267